MSSDLLSVIMSAVNAELDTFDGHLTDAEKEQASTSLKYLVEELMAMARSEDEKKKEYHYNNVTHYLSALLAVSPVIRAFAYRSGVNIAGRVLTDFAAATGSPLL